MSLLKRMAKKTKTSAKKKNATPETELTDENLCTKFDNWLEAKKQEKKAKADLKKNETDLIKHATDARLNECTRNGKYESSHKLTNDGKSVTVKFPNRYSKIDCDAEEDLREIFEDDDYNQYFKEKTTATMTEAAINDDEFIETVMEAIGEDKFSRYFEITTHIEVAKIYHENRTTNASLAKKHEKAADEGLVSSTKPSLTA